MQFKDLPQAPKPGQYMYCAKCGSQFSATKGDYFLRPPEDHMRCCGGRCVLVQEHTTREVLAR